VWIVLYEALIRNLLFGNKKMMRNFVAIILMLIVFGGCRKPYNPPVIASSVNYLVVEGVINGGADSTIIKLSRTVSIAKSTVNPEKNAVVTVENDQNNSYPLSQISPGTYATVGLNLDNTRKYRLRIKTTDNKEYLSDFETVKITPPIDSIGYVLQSNGLLIYANTHDPANNTRYYRWDYTETWQFHAMYDSGFKILYPPAVAQVSIVVRPPAEQVYYCFANASSSTIILGSSADLKSDVIYQSPIANVPYTSEKVEIKYSILLKQYALTKEAFNFWTTLKKNTEQLGSIFDALPSQLSGNIHCISNPSEPVVGYLTVTTVQTKRVFISNSSIPPTARTAYPYQCEEDSTLFLNPKTKRNEVESSILEAPQGTVFVLSPIPGMGGALLGYMRSSPECSDCTLRGVTKPPVFWK
jgi:hypothetical protein